MGTDSNLLCTAKSPTAAEMRGVQWRFLLFFSKTPEIGITLGVILSSQFTDRTSNSYSVPNIWSTLVTAFNTTHIKILIVHVLFPVISNSAFKFELQEAVHSPKIYPTHQSVWDSHCQQIVHSSVSQTKWVTHLKVVFGQQVNMETRYVLHECLHFLLVISM